MILMLQARLTTNPLCYNICWQSDVDDATRACSTAFITQWVELSKVQRPTRLDAFGSGDDVLQV